MEQFGLIEEESAFRKNQTGMNTKKDKPIKVYFEVCLA